MFSSRLSSPVSAWEFRSRLSDTLSSMNNREPCKTSCIGRENQRPRQEPASIRIGTLRSNLYHFWFCSQRVNRSLDPLSTVFSRKLTSIEQDMVIHNHIQREYSRMYKINLFAAPGEASVLRPG